MASVKSCIQSNLPWVCLVLFGYLSQTSGLCAGVISAGEHHWPWLCEAAEQEGKGWGLQPVLPALHNHTTNCDLPSHSCGQLLRPPSLQPSAVPRRFLGGKRSFLGKTLGTEEPQGGASVKAVGACERACRRAAGRILNVSLSPPFAETPTLTAATITPSCSSPRC